MARKSRRLPIRGVIGWKRLPSQEFIRKNLLFQEVGRIKDTRQALRVLEKNLARFLNGLKELTPGAIEYALLPTFELSQTYCPVKTGALVESGYISITSTTSGPRGEVGYGARNNPPYTVWVHERTDLNHEAPTRAKFLQAALEETQGQLLERVNQYISEGLGG